MLAVSVAALIGSLKVAVTAVVALTPVAARAGVMLVTVGGAVSTTTVVNDHTRLLASALPTTSFTPELPPVIVAVYVVDPASAADGVSVPTCVATV